MNPLNVENNPISNSMYLMLDSVPIVELGSAFEKHRIDPKINRIVPCIISPNITPNKNGKVTEVKIAGLISLYLGVL